VFLENGYTKEEMKMLNETRKIIGDETIRLTATTVRVPVKGGHSEAVNVEFVNDYTMDDVRKILSETKGVVVLDDTGKKEYPMPLFAEGKDEVFVGRLRRDESQDRTLNMWIVADNLRKGAATNAIQIAEYLVANGLL
jgi:aspartate-semialdehyde dehydrogenase